MPSNKAEMSKKYNKDYSALALFHNTMPLSAVYFNIYSVAFVYHILRKKIEMSKIDGIRKKKVTNQA